MSVGLDSFVFISGPWEQMWGSSHQLLNILMEKPHVHKHAHTYTHKYLDSYSYKVEHYSESCIAPLVKVNLLDDLLVLRQQFSVLLCSDRKKKGKQLFCEDC
ncbi:hypothetical protein ILYODFUR_032963 [Ilyodon furcidens]|uniref:Uncharacterized protein n=1 Tax=Ilyodon furcidens TaxID=33524 RepID=A0ABV0TEB5_9TELE